MEHSLDPFLAVHTSRIDPLPHQIDAVYKSMLQRQPLRFLMADDPGAGKTIMTGLFIKELIARGEIRNCMIVCPGCLEEQWHDELSSRFSLPFEIMPKDKAARTGNWFKENPFIICRLDMLKREDFHDKLEASDWDLIVCDEAHKMSSSSNGVIINKTKRYKLGELLSRLTRRFLLLTATPHNGKSKDFENFLSLLDGDRFGETKSAGVYDIDTSDVMRRMVKEDLLNFNGDRLFPERRASTVSYTLSDKETELYERVSNYVRKEFDRAKKLGNEGRKTTIGFALTVLQRRLASSPEAIYQSLNRRRKRLEKHRDDVPLKHVAGDRLDWCKNSPDITNENIEDIDDLPDGELKEKEDLFLDLASAARTIAELEEEISTLINLETAANEVRQLNTDRKWEELLKLLQSDMSDARGRRRKLIIFTEHRDTIVYLKKRIASFLSNPEAIVTIHGGKSLKKRKDAENLFTQNDATEILLATDAAGEGINLQRAHLMVNYDLPWNPNRLEQRFGRIHRIGQTETCHCWNLVASGTREGKVYSRLLEKLEEARKALGGKVFDILGELLFNDKPLSELLFNAILADDGKEAKFENIIDNTMERGNLCALIDKPDLKRDSMDNAHVQTIREDMKQAEARRLQPKFLASFFIKSFKQLGGAIREMEPQVYEITNIPDAVRDRTIRTRKKISSRYKRVSFETGLIRTEGKTSTEFICPGHPLLDSVVEIILEQNRDLFKRGSILIDENSADSEIRALVFLEHFIQDERTDREGNHRIISRQLQFAEFFASGEVCRAGVAPCLDYRPPAEEEIALLRKLDMLSWMRSAIESRALGYAVGEPAQSHLNEVKNRTFAMVDKTLAVVNKRRKIEDDDYVFESLKRLAESGCRENEKNKFLLALEHNKNKPKPKLIDELNKERRISPLSPNVIGGALIVPSVLFKTC